MIRLIRSLAPVLLLAACGTPLGGGSHDGSAARLRWERQGIDDYRYVYRLVCFCPESQPVQVTVHDGQVTSAESADPNTRIAEGEQMLVVLTVDEVFDEIEYAVENGTRTDVEYHPQLGYPTSAEIGTLATDAGVRYLISDLVPLN
jgi:hypothetical protein